VADLGDGMVTVALPLYVYKLTGSASATSATFVGEVVVGVLLSMIGGSLADSRDRRLVLVVSDIVRAVLLVAVASFTTVGVVLAFGIAARSMGMLDNPSFDSLVPGLADGDLQQVVGARRLTQSMSIMLGPAVGGIAVSVVGARATLGSASALYVIAMIWIFGMRDLDTTVAERRAARSGEGFAVTLAHTFEGLRVIRRTPFAVRLLSYWSLSMASVAMVMIAAIVWFDRDLHAPGVWYGVSIAAYGIGSLLGLLWAGGRTFTRGLPALLLRAIPLYAAFAAIAVAWHSPWLMLVSWFGWGVAMGPEIVLGETQLVELVPEAARGRVSAAQAIITQLGLALGYGVAGPLVDQFGARTTNLVAAAGTLATAAFWVGPFRRERRV
jgi:predicted MFS family arabinose efflux permease